MSNLTITNRTLSLGSTVYQVSNITSVGKYRLRPKYIFALRFIVVCGILGFFGIQWAQNNPDIPALKWLAGITIGLAGLGIWERFQKKKKYGLSIETNSGSARLIASQDESLIDKIIAKIIEVMNHKDSPASYTFNIADGDIINQKGLFETGVRVG